MASITSILGQFANAASSLGPPLDIIASSYGGVIALPGGAATLTVFGQEPGQHVWETLTPNGTNVTNVIRVTSCRLPPGEPTSVTALVNGADGQTVHNATIGQAMPQTTTSTSLIPGAGGEGPTRFWATPTTYNTRDGAVSIPLGPNAVDPALYRGCMRCGSTGPGPVYVGRAGGQPSDRSTYFWDRPSDVQAQSSAANQSQTSTGFNTDVGADEASYNGWLTSKPETARPGLDKEAEVWISKAVERGLNRHNRTTDHAWIYELVQFGTEMTEQRRNGEDNTQLTMTMNRLAKSACHDDIVNTEDMQHMRKSIKRYEWPDTLPGQGLHAYLRSKKWVKTTGNDTQAAAVSATQSQPASLPPSCNHSWPAATWGQWPQGRCNYAAPPQPQGTFNPGSTAPPSQTSWVPCWPGPGTQQFPWTTCQPVSFPGSQGVSPGHSDHRASPPHTVRFGGVLGPGSKYGTGPSHPTSVRSFLAKRLSSVAGRLSGHSQDHIYRPIYQHPIFPDPGVFRI